MQTVAAQKPTAFLKEKMKAALVKTIQVARARRRLSQRRAAAKANPPVNAPVQPSSDMEIQLVAMALERLSPATGRAGLYGTPVTVRVPDERTASVFRAALARSQVQRPTDRLIEIRVTDA